MAGAVPHGAMETSSMLRVLQDQHPQHEELEPRATTERRRSDDDPSSGVALPQPCKQAAPGACHMGLPPCILPSPPHHLSPIPPSPSLPKTSCSGETVQALGEKFRPLAGKKLPMKLLFMSTISLIRKWILTFDLTLCNFSPNSIFIIKL